MTNFVPGSSITSSPFTSAFAAIGGRPNIAEYGFLFEEAGVPSLNAAIKNWKRVCADAAEQRRRYPLDVDRKAAAEAAYNAEQRQAMIDGRPATVDYSTVTAAEAADREAQARHANLVDAEDQALLMVAAELRAHPADLGHAIAKARPGALAEVRQADWTARQHDQRVRLQWRPPRRLVENFYKSMVHLPVAYQPAIVRADGFDPLWPLPFDGTLSVPGRYRPYGVEWVEWGWAQRARKRGKGWRIDDNGVFHFLEVWTPSDPSILLPTIDPFDGTVFYQPGDMCMIGTGPNGEQGVTRAQVRGMWR